MNFLRAKFFDSDSILRKIFNCRFCSLFSNFKIIVFFFLKNMKSVIEFIFISNYCFRKTKIDPKLSFSIKFMIQVERSNVVKYEFSHFFSKYVTFFIIFLNGFLSFDYVRKRDFILFGSKSFRKKKWNQIFYRAIRTSDFPCLTTRSEVAGS